MTNVPTLAEKIAPQTRDADAFARCFDDESLAVGGLFPTPVVLVRLADHGALDAALIAAIRARRTVDPGIVASNVGGWHSTDFLSWSGAAGARVIEAAGHLVRRMTLMDAMSGLAPAEIAWRVAAWANVCETGDSHRPHGHPGAFWSGTYWVDDGGAGEALGGVLELQDPRGILPVMHAPHLHYNVENCLNAGALATITPSSGTMALFPAWLTHGVSPFTGTRPRISIAFNFSAP